MKAYIKPAVKVTALAPQSLMAGSPDIVDDYIYNPALTRGKRGTWGNLWEDPAVTEEE